MENLQGSVYEKRMIRAPVASLALLSYFADPSRLNWQEQVVTLYGPDPGAFRDTPRLDVAGNKRMSELCMFEMPTGINFSPSTRGVWRQVRCTSGSQFQIFYNTRSTVQSREAGSQNQVSANQRQAFPNFWGLLVWT